MFLTSLEVFMSVLFVGWFSVISILVFTCIEAHNVLRNTGNQNVTNDFSEDVLEDAKHELDEAYSTIPEEYIAQAAELPLHSSSSIGSSVETAEEQEAINLMLEAMVNSSTPNSERQSCKKTSKHLQKAMSIIQGRGDGQTSSLPLPRRSFARRRASLFENKE